MVGYPREMASGTKSEACAAWSLDHAEALSAFADGQYKRLLKVLVALIVGQTQLVEAGTTDTVSVENTSQNT